MKTRLQAFLTMATLAVITAIVILCWASNRQRGAGSQTQNALAATNPPVTLRWIKTGNFEGNVGTTFWATNHTSSELVITVYAIETNTGSGWTAASHLLEPVYFRSTAAGTLRPYSAAYATLQLAGKPIEGTWRIRASVGEKLSGAEGAVTRLRRYPFLVEQMVKGDTNIPMNPFSPNIGVLGRLADVVSQEILTE